MYRNLLIKILVGLFFPFLLFAENFQILGLDSPSSYRNDYENYRELNFDQFQKIIPSREFFYPQTTLVLSGGGARGFVHIGILKEIEINQIKIHSIVGTSIGAIIGALYATGYNSDEIINIIHQIDWDELFKLIENTDRRELILDRKNLFEKSLLKIYFKNFEAIIPQGFSFANKLNEILTNLFYNAKYISFSTYNELKIPFRAVATDIVEGKTVILGDKSLPLSVRASATIPLRHSPVPFGDMLLVDGGLMANLPVSSAISAFNPDLTIAVDATSPLFNRENLDRAWNVADQIVSIEMRKYTELESQKANFVINPELNDFSNDNFQHIDSLIKIGQKSFALQLPKLKNKIEELTDARIDEYLEANFPNELYFSYVKLQNISKVDSFNISKELAKNSQISIKNLIKLLINSETKYNKLTYQIIDNQTILISSDHPKLLKNIELSANISDSLNLAVNKIIYENYSTEVNVDFVVQTAEKILQEARKLGYCFLSIKSVKWIDSTNTLWFEINPGFVSKIIIQGNHSIKEDIIIREVSFEPGKIAKFSQLASTRSNILGTNLFSFVDIYPQRDSEGNVAVVIMVSEAGNQILQIGIRADNERNLQSNLDFVHNNLFNTGIQLNFSFNGGSRNQNFNILGLNPKFFGMDFTAKALLYYENRKYYIYDNFVNTSIKQLISNRIEENQWNKIGALFSLGNQIGKNGKLSLDLRMEKFRYFAIGQPLPEWSNLATLKINFQYDSGDNIYFPSEGSIINTYLETNLAPESPDFVPYSKIFISIENYFSLTNRHTFTYGGLIGAGDQTMPITEMFWLGGENNFWGLRQDQYFGRQIAKLFLSYRYRIPVKSFLDMYFSIYYNTGRIWLNTSEIKLSSFLHGFGIGYSLDTPLGPLSVSLARAMLFDKNFGSIRGDLQSYFSFGVKL